MSEPWALPDALATLEILQRPRFIFLNGLCLVGGPAAQLLQDALFAEAPSDAFACTQGAHLVQQPVLAVACGHTFCAECLRGPDAPAACPVDSIELTGTATVPNIALSMQLSKLRVFCPYAAAAQPRADAPEHNAGPRLYNVAGNYVGDLDLQGCQANLLAPGWRTHIEICEFAPTHCPNSQDCGLVRRRDIATHLESCSRHRCSHSSSGCDFTGTKADLDSHELDCAFSKALGAQKSAAMLKIRTQVAALQSITDALTAQLERVEATQKQLREAAAKEPSRKQSTTMRTPQAQVHGTQVALLGQTSDALDGRGELVMPFNLHCIGTFSAHTGPVWQIAARENFMFTTGSDECINVWDLAKPQRIKVLSGHTATVHSLCLFGDFLYSGDADKKVVVWDVHTLTMNHTFVAAEDIVCGLACTSRLIFVASFAAITVWTRDTFQRAGVISDLGHWVRSMCIDYDRGMLFAASHNVVGVWDATTLGRVHSVKTQFGSVHSMTISPKFLVTGTYNRNIHVYDRTTYEHVTELIGHTGTIHSLATSTEGRFLFSASLDSTVNIWNLQNMLLVQTLNRHEGSANFIFWHRTSGLLLSGSADRTVKVYRPFKGPGEVEKDRRPKGGIADLQACWGGANLPLRIRTTDRLSTDCLDINNVLVVAASSPATPKTERREHVPTESHI